MQDGVKIVGAVNQHCTSGDVSVDGGSSSGSTDGSVSVTNGAGVSKSSHVVTSVREGSSSSSEAIQLVLATVVLREALCASATATAMQM